MFGFFLAFASSFFAEVGDSIGKVEVNKHRESVYTMGFLLTLWGAFIFFAIAFFIRKEFIFLLASLPTFSIRVILEIAQAHATMIAITKADRSTYGFLRIGTIPLLLATDLLLGYTIGFNQIIGISIIIAAFIILLLNHGIKKNGVWFVVFTTFNAVITISLFKYNITHFNSVEAEQGIIAAILVIYFFIMAFFVAKENPIKFLKKPVFLAQSLASGTASVLISFAFLFAPASIITTLKRALAVLWTILAGNVYFHEKHFLVKLISFVFIVIGLVFLVL